MKKEAFQDEIVKAFEHQKKVNAAVNIHQLFSGFINQENILAFLASQSTKNLKIWEKHLRWQRQQELYRSRLMHIYSRPLNVEMLAWRKALLKTKLQQKIDRKKQKRSYLRRLQKFNSLRNRRIEYMEPHKDILNALHPKGRGPSAYEKKMAATFIQKFARGWLVRMRYKRIKMKVLDHGPSLVVVLKKYRNMMIRLRRYFHAPKQAIPLVYSELEEWLDSKKRYEDVFSKREYLNEMNTSEVLNYFQDCDNYPSQREVKKSWALIKNGHKMHQ
ncbi:IQ domain-containing protein M-like [Scyliorhinus torazame]|uniref:IQ domain-containing protein M-like n=1 Tax=Scyliorhinus torazame TaxID=75743 RepID=UPI003B5997E1